jgi:hypothetical protein
MEFQEFSAIDVISGFASAGFHLFVVSACSECVDVDGENPSDTFFS